MIDRSIGIAGLSFAFLFGVLQYYVPQFPTWAAYVGVMIGTFLLGVSAALLIGHRSSKPRGHRAKTAVLRLHVYADQRVPDALKTENIFRWYHLRQALLNVAPDGTQSVLFPITTVFITFEPEVEISTLKVRSPNIALPTHEVKEFNQRFAIIVFAGPVSEGTLEFEVQPSP